MRNWQILSVLVLQIRSCPAPDPEWFFRIRNTVWDDTKIKRYSQSCKELMLGGKLLFYRTFPNRRKETFPLDIFIKSLLLLCSLLKYSAHRKWTTKALKKFLLYFAGPIRGRALSSTLTSWVGLLSSPAWGGFEPRNLQIPPASKNSVKKG